MDIVRERELNVLYFKSKTLSSIGGSTKVHKTAL